MNDSIHLSKQFDEDLGRLRNLVLKMGGLVEAQVLAAMDCYKSSDITMVKEIVETDARINGMEIEVDDECVHIIAKRQPAASDLRLVMGVIKMVTDLERAGDEAKKIAKGVRRIVERGHQIALPRTADVRHVAEEALALLQRALDCFARMDVAQAHEVIRGDEKVDIEFKAVARQLITYMMEDPRTISTSMDIISIARAIERIGDHAKNIAEQVVYIAEGRDIRHEGKAIVSNGGAE